MKIWWCAVYDEGKLDRFDFCDPTFPDQAGDHIDCGPMRLIPDNAEPIVIEREYGHWPLWAYLSDFGTSGLSDKQLNALAARTRLKASPGETP